jgi:uncharacterized protein with NAD-binding domain and iron-sulfur cluster
VTDEPRPSVLILGAGLAGLATAYDLSRRGYRIAILDHPSWQNDLRTYQMDTPVMHLGCQEDTRRLLQALDNRMHAPTDTVVPVEFHRPDTRIIAYPSSRLPGPCHWIISLFRFEGLTWKERWRLFSHIEQMWEHAESAPSELDNRIADEWLASLGQTAAARRHVWNPLALWLTGNTITHLSAAVFAQLLSRVFLGRSSDAGLTCLEGTFGSRLITPLRSGLEQRGVEIRSYTDCPQLRLEQKRVTGIQLTGGTLLHADWYIAALPHHKLLGLLPERLLTRFAYFAQIADLCSLSQVTIQVTCRSTALAPRLILSSEHPFHQLTGRTLGPHTVRYHLSSIGHSALDELADRQIIDCARHALHRLLPETGQDGIQSIEVHHEDHATLSLPPGAAMLRPLQKSPLQNFLLAGAWTDTGWPANIESALVSARRCVEEIHGRSGD